MKIRARAPLRLGLAGGGTDLPPFSDIYGGYVLNATISLYSYAMLEPLEDQRVVFRANDLQMKWSGPAEAALPLDHSLPLHAGVYNRIVRDFNGGMPLPVELITSADVPPGSGLGSSSTMVVAILKAFVEHLQLPLGEYEIAHLAYEIERVDLGMSGGKQDQYAATFGGFNFLEFNAGSQVIVNPLRVKRWIASELESSLVLFSTGVSRNSSAVIDSQIANVTDGDIRSLEATMALKQDAVDMKAALLRGDMSAFARILGQGWENKKRTSNGISNPMLDDIYDTARAGRQSFRRGRRWFHDLHGGA
ncbi:GHMP kinase [Komagataeibacter sp. FNDCR2]|uniref:GHMP family kinase ATP-binding protein n=1 Tax=Komagataeibacter sp. FNDCR2 TaxID=2878682 RepID=UPI001E4A007E|nr:GHMP kinase [Komagataeibacter sp. FNDCR2]MCE2574094.1 GHMP kinase [Komagataeibacter sp. FNDCR2]